MILQNLSLKIYRQQKKRLCLKINLDTAPCHLCLWLSLRSLQKLLVAIKIRRFQRPMSSLFIGAFFILFFRCSEGKNLEEVQFA